MTWERDKKPKDILEVGQEIKVSVKELDKENKRIKLVYDKKGPDPWSKVEGKYNPSSDTATHAVLYKNFSEIGVVQGKKRRFLLNFCENFPQKLRLYG